MVVVVMVVSVDWRALMFDKRYPAPATLSHKNTKCISSTAIAVAVANNIVANGNNYRTDDASNVAAHEN